MTRVCVCVTVGTGAFVIQRSARSAGVRELPSVSSLPTSNAALTVLLMHNYPHTHSTRLIPLHEIASVSASAHS